jgi:nicotinamidase-related amidase
VIIGGISIDNCTMHTTMDLLRNGYNVFVVLDVSSTNNKLAEDAAVLRMTNAGAVPTTWLAMATELVGDWNTPHGQELMKVVQEHLKGSTVGEPHDTTPDGLGLGAS